MAQQEKQPDYHFIGIHTRYSSWTARVEILLEYYQIPHTKIYHALKEAGNVSESGLVPLLECRSLDNLRINDSLSISEFLAESNPDLPLWPRDRKLRALARSAAAEMHSGFQEIRNCFQANFTGHYKGNVPVTEKAHKEIKRLLTLWDNSRKVTKARLAELGEKDEGFLFGSFSIADAFFWPVLWRFRTYNLLPIDTDSENVIAWLKTMWNDPVMQKLGHSYYRQAERPETLVPHYEDVFKGRDDSIVYEQLPEDWKFEWP